MPAFLRQGPELAGVGLGMGAVQVKPAANPVMVTFVLGRMPALIPRQTMENLHLNAGEEPRHPVPWDKGCCRPVRHDLTNGVQPGLVVLQGASSASRHEPGHLVTLRPDDLLRGLRME